jgi:mRNA interferase YafQ
MLTLKMTGWFREDVRRVVRQGKDLDDLQYVVDLLQSGAPAGSGFFDHDLGAGWGGCRECHLEPDWLLVYRIQDNELVLVRTGSHAELFGSPQT